MNKRKILTTSLLFLVIIQSYGQLSGYYTIGGSTADYQYLSDAISDLYSQGINGDVTFALNSGTHSGTTFTAIPGASDSSRFTMQSATLDSSDVNFNQTIGFNQTAHITLRAITITAVNKRGIDFLRSNDIIIENCRINSSGSNNYNTEPINIEHFNSGGFSSVTINNCLVNSSRPCISCNQPRGTTTIDNCILNSTEWVSIKGDSPLGIRMYITNSILNGGISVRIKSKFGLLENNEIIGKASFGPLNSIKFNKFTGDGPNSVRAAYFEGNTFASFISGGYNGESTFVNNVYETQLSIGHANDIVMIGNVFHENIHLSFNKKLLFTNNTVYKQFYYGDTYTGNWNYRIYNNLIIGGHILARGHNSIISYNNFIDSAYLYREYGDIMVYDNNFCQGIRGNTSPANVVHNNYFPLIYCYYDTVSIHYDPGYDTANIGISTNPLLQGKGQFEAPIEDFAGNQRKNPPAIGANEIYICSDSLNNILTVPCGEELYLNLCNIPDTGSFWWTPDTCITNPDSSYTSVTACNDMTLYLNNSVYGIIDSVIILVEPFQVEIAPMPLFYCGYARTLNASYHPNADYHWTPEQGLSDPFIRNPELLIEDTTNMQYILECSIEGCGVSYDTLNIEFDGLPHAQVYYPEQSYDTVFFLCTATCTDEFLWDFGDGAFSDEQNPYHVYTANGYYDISLTVTNDYGSNTYNFSYYFYVVSTSEYNQNERIRIYPNPANNEIKIEGLNEIAITQIKVIDFSGNEILISKVTSNHAVLNTQDFKEGLYIIYIMTEGETFIEKVVVTH